LRSAVRRRPFFTRSLVESAASWRANTAHTFGGRITFLASLPTTAMLSTQVQARHRCHPLDPRRPPVRARLRAAAAGHRFEGIARQVVVRGGW
jgi:hypothetical protein